MWDTARLSHDALDLALAGRAGWSEIETRDADGSSRVTFRWSRPDLPFLSYSPGNGTLCVEASLPKLLRRDNIRLLAPDDVPRALDVLSDRIADAVGAPVPHCANWLVRGRLDAAFSWHVGEQVHDYLHALQQIPLPRHRSGKDGGTVYWKCARRWLRAYDKGMESRSTKAHGLLRFEVNMKRAKGDLTRLGIKTVMAGDVLTWHTARLVLAHFLEHLGVTELVVTDQARLLSLLIEHYGPAKAIRLSGFVAAMGLCGRQGLLERGFTRTYLWRSAKEVNALGAIAALGQSGVLPPLRRPDDRQYDGSFGTTRM